MGLDSVEFWAETVFFLFSSLEFWVWTLIFLFSSLQFWAGTVFSCLVPFCSGMKHFFRPLLGWESLFLFISLHFNFRLGQCFPHQFSPALGWDSVFVLGSLQVCAGTVLSC